MPNPDEELEADLREFGNAFTDEKGNRIDPAEVVIIVGPGDAMPFLEFRDKELPRIREVLLIPAHRLDDRMPGAIALEPMMKAIEAIEAVAISVSGTKPIQPAWARRNQAPRSPRRWQR